MPSTLDIIVDSLTSSKQLVMGYCQDLKSDEYLFRPTPAANCVAWLLGHLAITDRKIMTMVLNATDLPPVPEGFEKRFGRDQTSAQAKEFGDTSFLLPIFAQMRDLLIVKVATLDPSFLDQPLPFKHPRFQTIYGALNFMGVHAAMHAGQMTIIRRAIGRPPLV